ncbi:RlmE family RNA methyltransferase [Haliangium ochraceum]|uniref:Ribosomal RNA large subunit methyltransferase E n=1 Tax=Haliangium ochraceum (strain DSM 14365 / JCM 11303 / SMP-2) TaxID=502025 RepID=D0LT48_HALO1|nr:RlmE family RNA methyltransferase [Haliangium ochraceum]ACY19184.1 ribosomal RNA methyltransferase RrmJ/FtsJ [Haliangium ochraceum DSM 14365]
MSKLSDRRNRHDVYHQRARKRGFLARAVFKLEEIDDKLDLFRRGDRVLDLGCAPGSWLQYCRTRVGPTGELVGIDRGPLDAEIPGARLLSGDVFEVAPETLQGPLEAFDVVLSDMAPDTTGIRHLDQARSESLFERALDIADAVLAPGGNFVGKLFQGPAFSDLVKRCRRDFDAVKIVKPKGSRQRSIEQYVVARGRRG